MPALQDVWAELNAIDAWQARVQRADSAASVIPARQAEQMQLAAQMWPNLSPGALLALGKGGYRADHPMAQQLADLSAKLWLRDHPYGAAYGDPAVNNAMLADRARARAQLSLRETNARVGRDDGMSPGQRRLLDVSGAESGAPFSQDLVTAAKARGIITADNEIIKPVEKRYRDGEWAYRNSYEEETDRIFGEVMAAIAGAKGDDAPIPFKWGSRTGEAGKPGAYYPKTGVTDVVNPRKGVVAPDIPGSVDQWFESGRTAVADWAAHTRIPQFPGADVIPGQMQTAGFGPSPQDAIRTGFELMDMPVQEIQGQVRNLYAAAHGEPVDFWQTQSDFGIQATTNIDDAGTGLFVDPESEVAKERRRREAERGQIGGHNVTAGRWFADGLTPFDPDTRPAQILSGLVDFGVQMVDPSAFLLGETGKATRTRQLFAAEGATAREAGQAAGIVPGLRWMVKPVDAEKWLDSTTGTQVLEQLASTSSPYDVWMAAKRKIPMDLATRIADEARTPDEVRAVLGPELGTSVRRVDTFTTGLTGQLDRAGPIRTMPSRGRIDAHDQDLVAFEMESTLRNARAPEDVIREQVDEVGRADTPMKLHAAIRSTMDRTGGLLESAGVASEKVRRKWTALFSDSHEETSLAYRSAFAHQGITDPPLVVNGEEVWYPGAPLINEHAPQYMTLPDPRAIRRLTSRTPWLFTSGSGKERLPVMLLDAFQNDVWKPMQLMRLAWTARVVGEEQVRMAAAGLDSMFRHPLSYIAWRIGHKGDIDALGDHVAESLAHKNAMSGTVGNWVDRTVVPTGIKTTFNKGEINARDSFNEGWASELIRLGTDPVASQVARSESLDDAVEWFTRGAGNKFRGDLAAAHPGEFKTLDQARDYIERVQKRIDYATGGNADLFDAVRTGKIDGIDLMSGTGRNRQAVERLDGYHDEFAPPKIGGEETRTLRNTPLGDASQWWDSAVDRLFGVLMTNRTNHLSRSPAFKQNYWREAERLLPFSTQETADAVIAQAREANLGSRAIRRMERARARGDLNIEGLDQLAKAHGLNATKDLLYDLSVKGRFMDAARLVFPFGEAWSEVLTRWFGRNGLIRNNPKSIRRFQQIIQGARGQDFGEIMGAPEGQGFFSKNEFGEEVFVYPGSRLLTDKLLNIPIPLTGRVQGLSMFGSIIPGLGPAAQIPVGWILENKPGPKAVKDLLALADTVEAPLTGETVREMVNPFGSVGAEDQGDIADVANFVPPWFRTTIDALTEGDYNEQQYGNTAMSVAAYLRSTGRYGNSRADQQQLAEDAAFKARAFTLIKAIGQNVAPAAPSADWLLEANGREVRARALGEIYQKMKDEDFASADQEFLDKFGADVLAAMQPKSVSSEYAIPTTREGAKWVLDNPGIEDVLPHTYGFFAPTGGEFDYQLYAKQYREGSRKQLSLGAFVRQMNDVKGRVLYEQAVTQAGDDTSPEMQAWLRDVRERIRKEYPGYRDTTGTEKPDTEILIAELQESLGNDAAMKTEAGKGLALYMEARDMATEEADARGRVGFARSKDTEDLRAWLTETAGRIVKKYPEFKSMWDIVLSREVESA